MGSKEITGAKKGTADEGMGSKEITGAKKGTADEGMGSKEITGAKKRLGRGRRRGIPQEGCWTLAAAATPRDSSQAAPPGDHDSKV